MKKLSYKYKIIIAVLVFIGFAVGMFMYGYNILDSRNQILASAATDRQSEYELLLREQKSFEQGKKDLAALDQKTYPPAELFTKDTKVVKEIKTLEDAAAKYGIKFSLSISGSTKTALVAAGTTSEVYVIPYTASVEGSFNSLMKYMQATEHLQFDMHTTAIDISAKEGDTVQGQFNSEFYIKK